MSCIPGPTLKLGNLRYGYDMAKHSGFRQVYGHLYTVATILPRRDLLGSRGMRANITDIFRRKLMTMTIKFGATCQCHSPPITYVLSQIRG